MLVPLLKHFVERELAILLCWHPIAPCSRKMLITQANGNPLDGIQSIGSQAQWYFFG